jgi:hypothetical protein
MSNQQQRSAESRPMMASDDERSSAGFDPSVFDKLSARLRRPGSPHTVEGSLPVLFFGDLLTARVATVGLNPSHQEYLDRSRQNELDGHARRFETLGSLHASERATLSPEQCERAMRTMREYFRPGRPVYPWFENLDRVMRGIGFRYDRGEVAHLDLVQEATDPTWSGLKKECPSEIKALRAADIPFLCWQLETFPLQIVVCNGRSAFDEVFRLVDGREIRRDTLFRLTWYAAIGSIGGRTIGLVGWNIPLRRPTGLGLSGERQLGVVLAEQLVRLGVLPADRDASRTLRSLDAGGKIDEAVL